MQKNPVELLLQLLAEPDKWTVSDYTCYCKDTDLHITNIMLLDVEVKFEGQVVYLPFLQSLKIAKAVRKLRKLKRQQNAKYLQECLTNALTKKEKEE
jgi:hypothetical protein